MLETTTISIGVMDFLPAKILFYRFQHDESYYVVLAHEERAELWNMTSSNDEQYNL